MYEIETSLDKCCISFHDNKDVTIIGHLERGTIDELHGPIIARAPEARANVAAKAGLCYPHDDMPALEELVQPALGIDTRHQSKRFY